MSNSQATTLRTIIRCNRYDQKNLVNKEKRAPFYDEKTRSRERAQQRRKYTPHQHTALTCFSNREQQIPLPAKKANNPQTIHLFYQQASNIFTLFSGYRYYPSLSLKIFFPGRDCCDTGSYYSTNTTIVLNFDSYCFGVKKNSLEKAKSPSVFSRSYIG